MIFTEAGWIQHLDSSAPRIRSGVGMTKICIRRLCTRYPALGTRYSGLSTGHQNSLRGRWFFRPAALGWGQGQPCGSAHDVAFFRREHVSEAVGIDDQLSLIRRHGSQIAHCGGDHAPPLGRKLLHAVEQSPRFRLLARRQVFPGFHAAEHALLHLRREARKMLQALPQHLLLHRRQAAECRIALQSPLLLARRHIFVAAQPVAGMSRPCMWRAWRRVMRRLGMRWRMILRPLPSLHHPEVVAQSQRWRSRRHEARHGQHRRRHPRRHEIPPPHRSAPGSNCVLPLLTFQILTDSPLHRSALPGHRANRNQNTSRDFFPTTADHSPLCLAQPIGPEIRPAHTRYRPCRCPG